MTKEEYKQLLIDKSAAGMFPARDGRFEMCRYRTDGGKSCAIGLLIPDDKYTPEIEGHTARSMKENGRPYLADFVDVPEGVTWDQLSRLQAAHDRMSPWSHAEWRRTVEWILSR